MNKRAGSLLLIGMLSAGVPASAQHSSLSQTPANRRQSIASGAGAAHSARLAAQKTALALSLKQEETALQNSLKQEEMALQSSLKALKREETGVKAGRSPRSSLARLRAQAYAQQSRVDLLRANLADIRARRAASDPKAKPSSAPGAGSMRTSPVDDSERTRLLNQRIRQLLTAGANQAAGANRDPMIYPGGVPAAQLTPPYRSLQSMAAQAETGVAEAMSRQSAAEAELRLATENLGTTKQRCAAGVSTQADVSTQEAQLVKARAGLEAAHSQVAGSVKNQQQLDRLAALQRPIDVELRDAPVRQAAQTIAQASGMSIAVADNVPSQTRLTVVARGVALATVLDTIARQSGLFIVPSRTGNGIELQPTPTLVVNGQRTEFITPFAPWSPEWGINPAASMGYSVYGLYRSGQNDLGLYLRRAGADRANLLTVPDTAANSTPVNPPAGGAAAAEKPATPQAEAGGTSVAPRAPDSLPAAEPPGGFYPAPTAPPTPEYNALPGSRAPVLRVAPGAPSAPGGMPFGQPQPYLFGGAGGSFEEGYRTVGGAPVAITALNDSTFVVAHPAAGPGGEPAVMLTVYRLQGSQLRIVSSALHRLGSGNAARGYKSPAPEGMFGRGGQPGHPDEVPLNPLAFPTPRFAPAAPPTALPVPQNHAPSAPRAP